MKRLFLLLLLCFLALPLSARKRLIILHVNDTHSHFEPVRGGIEDGLGGVIERAAYIDSVRKAYGRRHVLLLHAGDFNQGTSYYQTLHGELEVNTINAMEYDCLTLGNHEFDNGMEDLAERLSKIDCPLVCANYDFSSFSLGKYVRPYFILRRGGFKIGIFGLLTDITRVVDRNISDRLPKYDDSESASKWADFLKNGKGCNLVIALTHIGYDQQDFTDQDLVESSENIDLVIGGHSHTFLEEMEYRKNKNGKLVPITQAGCWGEWIGQIEIVE